MRGLEALKVNNQTVRAAETAIQRQGLTDVW